MNRPIQGSRCRGEQGKSSLNELPLCLGNHKKHNVTMNWGSIVHIYQSIFDSSTWREWETN